MASSAEESSPVDTSLCIPRPSRIWWTLVVEPSPYPNRPGEDYTYGVEQVNELIDPMDVHWLEKGPAEEEIEKDLFSRRPLRYVATWLED